MVKRVVKQTAKAQTDHVSMAYDGIRMMLLNNEIRPGRKISYRQLAEKLDMSLTPVIQALKRLEYQGLVRHEPNRGYFIEPMSLQEVQEIYDMREILEISLLPDVIKKPGRRCHSPAAIACGRCENGSIIPCPGPAHP